MARAIRHYVPGHIWYIIETVRELLGIRAKGRDVVEGGQGYQLREAASDYHPLFVDENEEIGFENAYFWNLNAE